MDIETALHLAETAPMGRSAAEVRERLRSHIAVLLGPAAEFAQELADNRERGIARTTVLHARAVAADPVHDPAAHLRLLAKATQLLARYAAHHLATPSS